MGSQTFEGVRFSAYPGDHDPPHVHASYAGAIIILQLFLAEQAVDLADRKDQIMPRNAKRSYVKHVLRVASEHFDELKLLWEATKA